MSKCKIIVNNKRFKIENIDEKPYNSIIALPISCNGAVIGIGTLIGFNKVLVAGVSESFSLNSPIIPLFDGVDTPFGSFKTLEYITPEQSYNSDGPAYNYGVVIVAPNSDGKNIGDFIPALKIKTTNVSDLYVGQKIRALGYPEDKELCSLWESPGTVMKNDGFYFDIGNEWGPHFLTIDCDCVIGNFGGPVLNDQNEIIGIVCRMPFSNPSANAAIMMDDRAVEWINSQTTSR